MRGASFSVEVSASYINISYSVGVEADRSRSIMSERLPDVLLHKSCSIKQTEPGSYKSLLFNKHNRTRALKCQTLGCAVCY